METIVKTCNNDAVGRMTERQIKKIVGKAWARHENPDNSEKQVLLSAELLYYDADKVKVREVAKKYWIFLVIAWCIHNLEEALTMSKWLELNETKLPYSKFIPVSNIQQGLPIALIIASLLLILIPILAIYKKWDNRIFGVVLGICLINAIGHMLTTIVFCGYSPGVATALIINLPLSVYVIRRLFKYNLLKNFTWFHIFVYGSIVLIISISVIWLLALALLF